MQALRRRPVVLARQHGGGAVGPVLAEVRHAHRVDVEARERALQQTTASGPAAVGGAAELQAALEAERAKSAALEEALAKQAIAAEVNLQKVSAFWVSKLAEAKATLPAGAAAPALAAAAAPVAAADLVPVEPEFLEPDLSVRELRARLLSYGLSTIGLKSELRARLEGALAASRFQFKAWDAEALAWN